MGPEGESGAKTYLAGTHRVVHPSETLERVGRFKPVMGITRVADVTGLDDIGIPVIMVCRPNSRGLAVSQGKGLDLDAAKASGVMESIEGYHAERITLPLKLAAYEELRYTHRVVDVERLPRIAGGLYRPSRTLLWIEADDLRGGDRTWLPFEMVHTNYTLPLPSGSGCFPASSNGLASGNHPLEALSAPSCKSCPDRVKESCAARRIESAMASRPTEITLSDEERSELERVAALQKAPHQDVQRAKLVLYAAAGHSNVEIAARLDTSPKNVGRWRRRFNDQRLEGLEDKARSGRPRRFPPGADRRGQGGRLRAAGRGRAALAPLNG